VVVSQWPRSDPSRADHDATTEIAAVQAVVGEVRRFRSEQGVKPSQRVPARITGADAGERAIRFLLRLDDPGDDFAPTATLTTGGGVLVELDLSAAIDVAAEQARLTKDLAAARKELLDNSAKLGKESFTAKAPSAVIAKVRERLATAEADIARIEAALAALPDPPAE
jgi:valyl-tRNA synthetase